MTHIQTSFLLDDIFWIESLLYRLKWYSHEEENEWTTTEKCE